MALELLFFEMHQTIAFFLKDLREQIHACTNPTVNPKEYLCSNVTFCSQLQCSLLRRASFNLLTRKLLRVHLQSILTLSPR